MDASVTVFCRCVVIGDSGLDGLDSMVTVLWCWFDDREQNPALIAMEVATIKDVLGRP